MREEEFMTITEALRGGLLGLLYYIVALDFELIIIWFIVAIVDVIIGVLNAMRNHEFSSKKMRNGILVKTMEFLFLVAVAFAQRVLHKLGIDVAASSVILGAFIFKDVGSILETMIASGINFPNIVISWFDLANDKINKPKE